MLKNIFQFKRVRALIALSMLSLGGCTDLTLLGDRLHEYSCKGLPDKPSCKSAREVYEQTNHINSFETGTSNVKQGPANAEKKGDSVEPSSSQTEYRPQSHLGASLVPGQIVPVRTSPTVMRIWFAPWETADGDLHMPSMVFSEIQQRTWQIGLPNSVKSNIITPLNKTRYYME